MNTQCAIVTGASRGIGRTVAHRLATLGYRLALFARTESELQSVAEECCKLGPEVERPLLFAGDITNVSHVTESLASLIDNTDSIDVLFNNAGIFLPGTSEAKPDDFARMLAVNLTASFTFLHTVVPLMRTQKRGYIFHLSSYVGVEALPGTGAYAATKFGMMGLNQSLFRELVKEGINVTAIAPSWVNTAAAKDSPIAPEEMIQPSDIADTVEYLLRLRHGACVERVVIQCRSAVSNGPV